ncbi:MAG: polymer-forming cytoskeletal protein [Gemmatimonadaceae bacterium]|nr:polymer-forming cytoskeletal protein [Gemmatimonadaceae bacterium]
MAIWKESAAPKKPEPSTGLDPVIRRDAEPRIDFAPQPASTAASPSPSIAPVRRAPGRDAKESLVSEGLTIEGTIQGTGHIRIAGRFTGDVNVDGNVSIEAGAKVVGGVVADTVTIGGELDGNIDKAARVELLESGVLNGDLKADSLTVAAGSRMRGRVEFGWPADQSKKSGLKVETGSN